MDLGAQRQTEIQLGTDRNQARAKMNSALPYIDPHLGAKTPGVAVLPHVPPPAWPHSTGPHTSCWSASPRRPALCLFPSLACWSQSSLCPTSSCLSSQGFRLRVERVTSRRTCLQKAQPYPGLAPQPDSRRLCTKAPLFPQPPDAPQCTGHKKPFFPQFHSLQAHPSGEAEGWGDSELLVSPPLPPPPHTRPPWAARMWRQSWGRFWDQWPRCLTVPQPPSLH